MNILKDIQDNAIIICDDYYKKYILKNMSQNHIFLNVKFYSKKSFLDEYLFKYDEKTIYYLVNKYNLKVDIAKMYLDNLKVVEDKFYNNPKIDYLVNLKKELDNEKLLKYNIEFKEFIKNYKIYIINYPFIDNYELEIFNKLNAKIINDFNKYELTKVYEFENIEEEINFVLKSICKLLDKGISINKIKLMGVNEDYYNDLNRLCNFYNIPINIPSSNTLFGNVITKEFLNNYDKDICKSIEVIKDMNSDIVNKIITICNKYNFVNDYLLVKILLLMI